MDQVRFVGFRHGLHADYVFVWNFHTHRFLFAILLESLFYKNGFAGIADESSDRRKLDVSRAVVCFHTVTHESGKSLHKTPSWLRRQMHGNSTTGRYIYG